MKQYFISENGKELILINDGEITHFKNYAPAQIKPVDNGDWELDKPAERVKRAYKKRNSNDTENLAKSAFTKRILAKAAAERKTREPIDFDKIGRYVSKLDDGQIEVADILSETGWSSAKWYGLRAKWKRLYKNGPTTIAEQAAAIEAEGYFMYGRTRTECDEIAEKSEGMDPERLEEYANEEDLTVGKIKNIRQRMHAVWAEERPVPNSGPV